MLDELMRRSGWLTLGAVLGRLAPLLLLLAAGRGLEPAAFASASAGFAWCAIAMGLTGAGLATVLTQRLAAAQSDRARRALFGHHARWSVSFAVMLGAATLLLGQRFASPLFGDALDDRVLLPAALAGVLWTQVGFCVAALNGCGRARQASLLFAACGVLQGLAMAAGWWLGGGAPDYIVSGLALGNMVAAALAFACVRSMLRGTWAELLPWSGASPPAHRPVAVPVLWNTLSAAAVLPASLVASGMVARAAGSDSARQMAQYFLLEQLHQLLVYAPGIVGQAALPLLSGRWATEGEPSARRRLTVKVLRLCAIGAVAGTAIALIVGWRVDWLITLLGMEALQSGDSWAVRWMMLNAGLSLSLAALGGTLVASGRVVWASALNLGWAALFLVLTSHLADHGVPALQFARFSASLALGLVTGILIWRFMAAPRPPNSTKVLA
jgi:O-antigen/teichoic acid export membrane protein